jgi:hypothetical protein
VYYVINCGCQTDGTAGDLRKPKLLDAAHVAHVNMKNVEIKRFGAKHWGAIGIQENTIKTNTRETGWKDQDGFIWIRIGSRDGLS